MRFVSCPQTGQAWYLSHSWSGVCPLCLRSPPLGRVSQCRPSNCDKISWFVLLNIYLTVLQTAVPGTAVYQDEDDDEEDDGWSRKLVILPQSAKLTNNDINANSLFLHHWSPLLSQVWRGSSSFRIAAGGWEGVCGLLNRSDQIFRGFSF